ncbi:hypothetical protein EVG20_g5854 [Dentipellis fragilis]|uniref:F-box domain-containing protein n=1 Tax=Dentipellis fragilis TaxID=205917 RepID=A0A4Y9YT54_9AGAM|nr:hypothetical protein EVG20_g5854 [Dentipellis fragilis]
MVISLPPDLLFIIFRLASTIDVAHDSTSSPECLPSALATYALVNKTWHNVAQHGLYTRLYLRPSTHADTLMLLLRTFETTPALASLTHALSYSAYALARGDTCTLARILQRCSARLEHLSLHGWTAAPDERSRSTPHSQTARTAHLRARQRRLHRAPLRPPNLPRHRPAMATHRGALPRRRLRARSQHHCKH